MTIFVKISNRIVNFWGGAMNLFRNYILVILLLISTMTFIPSCMKNQPLAKPILPSLTAQTADYQVTQNNITLQAKIIDTQGSKNLFNGYIPYAKKLPRQPQSADIETIVLSVHNKTNSAISITKKDIRLLLVDYRHIYFSPSTQQKLKIFGGTVTAGAVPFFGISLAACLSATPGCCPCWLIVPLTLGTGTALLGSGSFLTGSFLWQQSTTKQMHRDFKQVTLTNEIVIQPQQHREFLCFVRKQLMSNQFTITLLQKHTASKVVFPVTLNKVKTK